MSQITILDVAKRTGSDAEVGLIEEVVTYAPELMTVPVRLITGTLFKTTTRSGYPTAGFRGVNEGVTLQKSTYTQKSSQCFFLDTQMQVDEAVASADTGEIGDLLAQEAAGAMEGSAIKIGSQFYYGSEATSDGFNGLLNNYDSTNMVVDATGSTTSTSAYFVYEDLQGVHFVLGNNKAITLNDWEKQQITDSNSNKYMAWVNNACSWIGLAFGHEKSVGRVKNCTATKPFTDALAAEILSKFPIYMRNSGKIRCYINRDAAFQLQKSRSSVGQTKSNARGDSFAAFPVETNGIPITVTDSIVSGGAEL